MDDEEKAEPQYRNRVKGYIRFASWDNGEPELVEIPKECPVVTTIGVNVVSVE